MPAPWARSQVLEGGAYTAGRSAFEHGDAPPQLAQGLSPASTPSGGRPSSSSAYDTARETPSTPRGQPFRGTPTMGSQSATTTPSTITDRSTPTGPLPQQFQSNPRFGGQPLAQPQPQYQQPQPQPQFRKMAPAPPQKPANVNLQQQQYQPQQQVPQPQVGQQRFQPRGPRGVQQTQGTEAMQPQPQPGQRPGQFQQRPQQQVLPQQQFQQGPQRFQQPQPQQLQQGQQRFQQPQPGQPQQRFQQPQPQQFQQPQQQGQPFQQPQPQPQPQQQFQQGPQRFQEPQQGQPQQFQQGPQRFQQPQPQPQQQFQQGPQRFQQPGQPQPQGGPQRFQQPPQGQQPQQFQQSPQQPQRFQQPQQGQQPQQFQQRPQQPPQAVPQKPQGMPQQPQAQQTAPPDFTPLTDATPQDYEGGIPRLKLAGADIYPKLHDGPKFGRWTLGQLMQTDSVVPAQYGSNKFATRRGMTEYGAPRDVRGKHLHRIWEDMDPGQDHPFSEALLRETDGIIPGQYGSNKFASRKGMTEYGSPRDVSGKHIHRIWEGLEDGAVDWPEDLLRETDSIIPAQYGSNKFASQKGMTSFGAPRDTRGKHLHRIWEDPHFFQEEETT